eukprot:2002070-Pyramimonas_sp.AAC.1
MPGPPQPQSWAAAAMAPTWPYPSEVQSLTPAQAQSAARAAEAAQAAAAAAAAAAPAVPPQVIAARAGELHSAAGWASTSATSGSASAAAASGSASAAAA